MKKLTRKEVIKRIKKEYPQGVELVYVDYNDSFNDNKELMEELANTGYVDSLFEQNWTSDSQWETIQELTKQIFTEEEIEQIDNDDELANAKDETFYELDTSDVDKGMLKNTSRRFFFYDLNYNVCPDAGYWQNAKEIEQAGKKIAKILKIDYKEHQKDFDELVANAGYGGDLCILFTAEPIALYGEKENVIQFDGQYDICLMQRGNGSGWSVDFNLKKPLRFAFNRENLHDDEGMSGYSFSGDVCGLVKYDVADLQFHADKRLKKKIETNAETKAFKELEAKYEATYKAGKCTFGDMKFSRHRNTPYINDYPCGNKCQDCGTFWID
jgi:hypothetical protein